MKAIFDTKRESGYDDNIVERYHFPNDYLAEATRALGDWIIYREPRRNRGRKAYIAVARLVRIDPDPSDPSHSYARMAGFLPFDELVPLAHGGGFYEKQLDFVPARLRGVTLHGKAIRNISDDEFAEIVHAGLRRTLDPENAARLELDPNNVDPATLALVVAPGADQKRRIAQILVNRPIRDANFRDHVIDAYDNQCAVTGLRIVNGGGRVEAQAAHIWSVEDGGPDVVQNGIALSATAHWLFDRHLISLTDDYGLLVSHNRVPSQLQPLFKNQLARIHLPQDKALWPYVPYVQRHRAAYMNKD